MVMILIFIALLAVFILLRMRIHDSVDVDSYCKRDRVFLRIASYLLVFISLPSFCLFDDLLHSYYYGSLSVKRQSIIDNYLADIDNVTVSEVQHFNESLERQRDKAYWIIGNPRNCRPIEYHIDLDSKELHLEIPEVNCSHN